MVLSAAHRRLRVVLWHLVWFGCLFCLDLVCQRAFGPDYFRKTGFPGLWIAINLGLLPSRFPEWRRERKKRVESHRAFMQRHRERMAGLR